MRKFHPAFNPLAAPPAQLAEGTVGERSNALIDRIADRIAQTAASEARPHTLVIGSYGSGKTHALRVAVHRATDSAAKGNIAVAWIAENDFGINSYEKLLVEAIRSLDLSAHYRARLVHEGQEPTNLQKFSSAANADLNKLYGKTGKELDQLSTLGNTQRIEEIFLEAAKGRTVILVVENLQRIFANIQSGGQSALRGLIETQKSILLLASAPALFPDMSHRTKPWYGSFNVERMPELTVEEVADLLTRLTTEKTLVNRLTSATGRNGIEEIHSTLGGTPRVWSLIAKSGHAKQPFNWGLAQWDALDILSPHFQSKFLELSPLEQRVVRILGLDGKKSTTELSRHGGMSVSTAGSTLARLTRSGVVEPTKAATGDRRVTWYSLCDRLFGIWMLWSFTNDLLAGHDQRANGSVGGSPD